MLAGLLLSAAWGAPAQAQLPTQAPSSGWKAGAASVDITPQELMWMAGYAARKKPADGYAQPLYAKALALESAAGERAVIVTLDLIGVLRTLRDGVEKQVGERFDLPPSALLLNASHTHCGPEYRERAGREGEAQRYHAFLEKSLVTLVGQALERLEPADLSWGEGRASFAANRRGGEGGGGGATLSGPVDHSVPVLRVAGADGALKAILFGYACHNTTLSSTAVGGEPRYEFNGDYAGFAQEHLQAAHPEAVALFLNGCGADQNPHPRRDMVPGVAPLEMARHHGRTLALAVEAALNSPRRPIRGPLRSAFRDVEVIRTGNQPGPFPYPVQVLRFGDDLVLAALASEVVVDYSLRIKRELLGMSTPEVGAVPASDSPFQSPRTAAEGETAPAAVWVAGYSNGYFGYIPSVRVLTEGGYEAGPWDASTEERIVSTVFSLNRALKADGRPADSQE